MARKALVFSEEEIREMVEMNRNGRSISAIADHFGVCASTIYKWLDGKNLPRKMLPRYTFTDEQTEHMKELYTSGLSCNAIGKRFGVTGLIITRWLNRNNFALRSAKQAASLYFSSKNPERKQGLYESLSDEQKKGIFELYQEGWKVEKICKLLGGINQATLYRVLHEQGVPEEGRLAGKRGQKAYDAAAKMYAEGMSAEEIAEKIGVRCNTIKTWILKNFTYGNQGNPKGAYGARQSEGTIKEMIKAFRGGTSIVAISKRFGVHPNTIRRYFQNSGVEMRRCLPNGLASILSEEQKKDILSLYKRGVSVPQIVAMLGVYSPSAIYKLLKDNGVSLRKIGTKAGGSLSKEEKWEIAKHFHANAILASDGSVQKKPKAFSVFKDSCKNITDERIESVFGDPAPRPGAKFSVSVEDVKKMVEMRRGGSSFVAIAKEFGLTRWTVNHYFERLNEVPGKGGVAAKSGKIRRFLEAGISYSEIARKLDLSRKDVVDFAMANGYVEAKRPRVSSKKAVPSFSNDVAGEIVSSYISGCSIVFLARQRGVRPLRIRDCLVEHGIAIRSQAVAAGLASLGRSGWSKVSGDIAKEIAKGYEEGKSIRFLAKRHGVCGATIMKCLEKNNVSLRSKSEAIRLANVDRTGNKHKKR